MIRQVSYAECEGCGYRVEGTEHPQTWVAFIAGGEERHFCSQICLVQSVTGVPPNPVVFGIRSSDLPIIECAAAGLSTKEIALKLGRSPQTIKNRLTGIMHALGAEDRMQAVLLAHQHGIVNLNTSAAQLAHELAA